MNWSGVGDWIKDNAGTGAKLVGSLLTGNVVGAVAAGAALVTGATGTDDPAEALDSLKNNPEALVKLKELYYKNEDSVRQHLQEMTRLELEDDQKEHETTASVIISGDNAADRLVRWTRPLQSWCSLLAAFLYIFSKDTVEVATLSILMALPFAYAGLRQIGKGVDAISSAKVLVANGIKKGG